MSHQLKWEKEVRDVFEKIRKHQEPYSIVVNGVPLEVLPNVFSPAYFTDSAWFAKTIPGLVGQKRLLEIGTGTGIVALSAALHGAEVTATDLNVDAVENTKVNFQMHGVRGNVFISDVYESIPKGEKFDFIFWNHPFNRGTDSDEDILLKAGFDFQYRGLERYISQARGYLAEYGRLLLGTGSFALLPEIASMATMYGYEMKLLERIELPLAASSEIENDYRIYEFVERK
jgi:release factor glutamine methyltransferase